MTLAVANSTPAKHSASSPHAVPIVILGTDAVLAALPATAVQLVHACMKAGFASVIPASWGDELIAAATLRRLAEFGDGPAIQCSCPIVAHRLLSVSGDLRPVMLPLVPPPVALARYVHARSRPVRARVTYVGTCPGAIDEAIDIRMTPEALLSMLAERDISLEDQPRVFESFIPADRRRFRSQPGGVPTAEALWSEQGARTLVEVDGEDFAAEVAQHVLAGRNVLIDAATKLGCVCSGAVDTMLAKDARGFLVSLEPPRANAPVVDEQTPIELDQRIPAAPRTPVDVMAVPSTPAPTYSIADRVIPPVEQSATQVLSPPHGTATVPDSRQAQRTYSPGSRPVTGAAPVIRAADGREGRTLPRAYVARRRLTPRNIAAVPEEPQPASPFSPPDVMDESIPDTVELVEVTFLTETPEVSEPSEALAESQTALESVAAPDALSSTTNGPGAEGGANASEIVPEATPEVEESEAEDEIEIPAESRVAETSDPAQIELIDVQDEASEPVQRIEHVEATAPSEAIAPSEPMEPPTAVEAVEAVEAPPTEVPATRPKLVEPAAVVVEPSPPANVHVPTVTTAPAPVFNSRHIVLFMLGVVAVAIVVSAAVAIYVERRFAPQVTAPVSSETRSPSSVP
jgi:hypothetical protein